METYGAHVEAVRRCIDPTQAKLMHARIVADGLDGDTFLGNLLIQMYGKCKLLDEAHTAFSSIARKNTFSFTLLMSACVRNGQPRQAIAAYKNMRPHFPHHPPDKVALLIALGACAATGDVEQGERIHGDAMAASSDAAVENAVMSMYDRCGSLDGAKRVFTAMAAAGRRSVVSWNTMISAFARRGDLRSSLRLMSQMDLEGERADRYTFVSILGACSSLEIGRNFHSRIAASGLETNVFVGTALLSMYSRHGRLDLAARVFAGLKGSRNVVSWNAMLAAFVQNGDFEQVFVFFRAMEKEKQVAADAFTFSIFLAACTSSGNLAEGRRAHAKIIGANLESDRVLRNALVNLYAKSSCLDEARAMLDDGSEVVAWNALISGYAACGRGRAALELYGTMAMKNIGGDAFTFASLLSACSSVAQGMAIHSAAAMANLDHDEVVQKAMVSMYARCGSLRDARAAFEGRRSDRDCWTAMILAYSNHGRGVESLILFRTMVLEGLNPDCITITVILHACSHEGLVEEARENLRCMRDDYGIGQTLEHYHCVIDLLGRLGRLDEAMELIQSMPYDSRGDVVAWMSLLSACKTHRNVEHAAAVVKRIAELSRRGAAPYVLLSSIA